LGASAALTISRALLDCALEDAAAWPGALVIAPYGTADATWAAGLLARAVAVQPQPGGNLGERLSAVDAAVRALGHERLLFIGSDAPSLTVPDLCAAAAALERSDVVLAAAQDGGVTLMGARCGWPSLGRALESACRARGLSVTQMAPSYDVDEASDLATARRALAADSRPARRRLRELLLGFTA